MKTNHGLGHTTYNLYAYNLGKTDVQTSVRIRLPNRNLAKQMKTFQRQGITN